MFKKLIKELYRLNGTEIEIYASGEYPTKQRTKVQDVAKYQNDGTAKIKAAHFVERAARRHRHWKWPIFHAIADILFENANMKQSLNTVGLRISHDINVMVNRIRTGRLKHSMLPRIKQKSRSWSGHSPGQRY